MQRDPETGLWLPEKTIYPPTVCGIFGGAIPAPGDLGPGPGPAPEPPPSVYADEVLADSPFVYWRLDEDAGTEAADATGNGNTGTYQNAPTLGAAGLINEGTAVTFNGTDEAILADSTAGDWATFAQAAVRTIEFWVKDLVKEADHHRILGTANDNNTTFMLLNTNFSADGSTTAGHTTFRVRDEGNNIWAEHFTDDTIDIYDGSAHHVVIAQDDHRTWRIYVDKTLMSTTTGGSGTYDNPAAWGYPLAFMAQNNRSVLDRHAAGTLDEIALYNSALSQARVEAHFDAAA